MNNQSKKHLFNRNNKQSSWKLGVKGLAVVGILIAMNLALSRVGITTPVVRITFAYLPIVLIGILFGPIVAGTAAALSDILAFILLGGVGGFFPGFTLSAFIGGVAYGLLLHKKEIHWWRILAVVAFNTLVVNLTLNTTWILILTESPLAAILPIRVIQNSVTSVIHFVTIWFLANNKQLKTVYMKFSTAKN